MPGKRITDFQVLKFKDIRRSMPRSAAAAKVAISERSARQIEKASRLPSQSPPRHWRTRLDPLAEVWAAELVPLLVAAPHLNAATLLDELQRQHPADYGPGLLRTLQRRLRQWRVQHGSMAASVRFSLRKNIRPAAKAFRTSRSPTISASRSAALPSRTGSISMRWHIPAGDTCRLVEGGESFIALATGLQDALWRAGGAPEEHRTDSLSAAFRNLPQTEGSCPRTWCTS